MNQQQFSKYLNGVSRPSPRNLRRLAQFFRVNERDLDLPHDAFVSQARVTSPRPSNHAEDSLSMAFPGDLSALRKFVGNYQVYYSSPALPGETVIAAMLLHEADGSVITRSLEALRTEGERKRHWTRCNGKAAFHGERLFVVDFEANNGGALSMTTLVPPYRHRSSLIFGLSFFLASYPWRSPHTSPVVWKWVGERVSARELLQACGTVAMDSHIVHPAIRRYLQKTNQSMSNGAPYAGPDP